MTGNSERLGNGGKQTGNYNDGTERNRYWECPDCGHTESRHHSATKRPFCDECEFRDAVLVELKPKGEDTAKFYDDEGHALNVPTEAER